MDKDSRDCPYCYYTGSVHCGDVKDKILSNGGDLGYCSNAQIYGRRTQPQQEPVGNWIWSWLMDWCKRNGIAPATQDSLFAMVKDARNKFEATSPVQRCPLCDYQHGHAIGCKNNPVDIALSKMAENARELGLDYEQAPVTEEWKMVPVEPTREMWTAVNKLDDQMTAGGYDGKGCSIEQAWNCLLDAAPTPPAAKPALKPLTDEQVWLDDELMKLNTVMMLPMDYFMRVVRAVEAAHGIKEKNNG